MYTAGNKTAKKLTLTQVQEMRKAYGEGATQGALCRHFGVSIGQVGRIVRGESWAQGAGARMPTQAEGDAILARILERQAQLDAAPELREMAMELDAAFKGTKLASNVPERVDAVALYMSRRAPVSPLDGGDMEDESGGEGLKALQGKAEEEGLDIEKLRGEGK